MSNPYFVDEIFEGIDFTEKGRFTGDYENSIFNNCLFTRVILNGSSFEECIFNNCDFSGTLFGRTNLEKADLRTSTNIILDPEINKIKGAKFSVLQLGGLLTKYGIKVDKTMI